MKVLSTLLIFFLSISQLFSNTFKQDPKVYPVVILGSGISSLSASLYLTRAGIIPYVVEGAKPGGAITQSNLVENWPGEEKISGGQLAEKMRNQVEKLGALFFNEEVVSVDFSKKPFTIQTKNLSYPHKQKTILANNCIIAMGTTPHSLEVLGENEFWGKGVSNCVLCDGAAYTDRTVAVVGGSESAIVESLYLSNLASKVYLFVRKDALKYKDFQKFQALQEKENVEIYYNTTVEKINGEEFVESVDVKNNKNQKKQTIELEGLFLAIGSTPNTKLFKGQVKLDNNGYIVLKKGQQTSTAGVYAVGDICHPDDKQAIYASSDGAKAAIALQKELQATSKIKQSKLATKVKVAEAIKIVKVIEIETIDQFHKEIGSAKMPVLIDFYATWCPPCKRIAPRLEEGAQNLQGKVKILKVNVEKLPKLSEKYQITSMPTLLVFDHKSKMIGKKRGSEPISELLGALEEIKTKTIPQMSQFLEETIQKKYALD